MPKISGKLKKAGKGWQVEVATKKGGTALLNVPEAALRFPPSTPEGTQVDIETDAANRILKVTAPGQPEVSHSPPPAPPKKPGGGMGGRPGGGGPQGRGGGGGRFSGAGQSGAGQSGGWNRQGGGGGGGNAGGGNVGGQRTSKRKAPKAPASVIGLPFHNPYTFMPFASTAPLRHEPTWLTADEQVVGDGAPVRYTGVLELQISTLSPLITCESRPGTGGGGKGHKKYRALTIGGDVVVPATGVRGALRNLLTIITGGALTHVNRHAHLVQGRDLNLGPATPNSKPGTPSHVFLAEVERPGTAFRPGIVRVGMTMLFKLEDLEKLRRFDQLKDDRKSGAKPLWAKIDSGGNLLAISETRTPDCPWKVKLSGRPINTKNKREAALLVDTSDAGRVELASEYWEVYHSRHAFGDRPELRKGDLVWLEPVDPAQPRDSIRLASQVRSLQWSRWGKRGQLLMSKIPASVHPDYLRGDGMVDEVTDLFGQVSPEKGSVARPFAARVRPENLVFFDAAARLERNVTLAPLSQPHPGCVAFYRDGENADDISDADNLRGYKVYRTTTERGAKAPWRYETQGVYGSPKKNDGLLRQPKEQSVNKTCDLVPEGLDGHLRIAFRSLTARELALLVQACHVPWRLGGGKPLGLGQCRVLVKNLIDEVGEPLEVPGWRRAERDGQMVLDGWQQELNDEVRARAAQWEATQQPVAMLRYPRAADENKYGKTRGGHVWFQRHAKPRMIVDKEGDQSREPGLEPLDVSGDLLRAAKQAGMPLDPRMPLVSAQILPPFDPARPDGDKLYGYDGFGGPSDGSRERVFGKLEAFDEQKHVSGREASEGNQGKNAEFRQQQRKDRGEQGGG